MMGVAAFLILAAALGWLWHRVDKLENELQRLRGGPFDAPAAFPPLEPVPSESAATPDRLGSSLPAGPERSPTPTRGRWLPSHDFEDLFGRLLPIWAGGVTLAVAGFFLVRWSIDAGLLTAPVRVLLAALFGAALLAGAEVAYRWRERVADARVAQALAGAGLATLYAAFYLAGSTYGLIGPAAAFLGLAVVTAGAIVLSFRFGLPSAVLGLVGGFAAPALVASEDANLSLLALYLALVTAGLSFTGRRQERSWIGVAALAAGLGWGAALVGGGVDGRVELVSVGLYLVLLGSVWPAIARPESGSFPWARTGGSILAAGQLAALVAQGGFGPLEWGLYLLLGAAGAWLAWREPAARSADAAIAAVGVLLLFFWNAPPPATFGAVSAALAAIFAATPLVRLWQGRGHTIDVIQPAGVALGLAGALYFHFAQFVPSSPAATHAIALAAMATLPGLAAHFSERSRANIGVRPVWAAQAAAALIGYGALAQVLPRDALGWTAALIAAAAAWRGAAFTGLLCTLAGLAAGWAVPSVAVWLGAGSAALAGVQMAVGDLPRMDAVLLFVVPAAGALAAWRMLAPPAPRWRGLVDILAASYATIALHTLYRHLFEAVAGADMTAAGVLERAVWEALVVATGWAALARGWRLVAASAGVIALAHFAWFALVLHNPLWSQQAVGAGPIVNALVPMYAAGFAALWLAGVLLDTRPAWLRWLHNGAVMLTATLFVLSQLRQAFAGSFLEATRVGETEDLLRSLAGIVLAASFLIWGTRMGKRSWRIGSLVLMVIAVLKVFLIDAAGLGGLARIASFMMLGFSLIGIGWFYNRQLRAPPAA